MKSEPRARVFIVDDDVIIAMDLQDQISSLGYDACGFESDADLALDRILALKPDLVVMDVNLGGRDGMEIVREVHRQIYIPVIYVTAYSAIDLMKRAAGTHAFQFLAKPFTERDLGAAIKAALGE